MFQNETLFQNKTLKSKQDISESDNEEENPVKNKIRKSKVK